MTKQTTGAGNYRWRVLTLFFLATTINYIDRQIIAILKPFISEDLGWSEADYGFIITGFQIAYAAGMLLTGWFLDKFGTKIGYLWSIVIWSLAAMGHAFARNVYSFISARFFLGLGESANFPASVKGVSEWFPQKERALATGLFNSGSTVGAILAPVIVSAITVTLGWRMAFVITGSFGVVWIVFWLFFYKHPARHPRLTKAEWDYINQDNHDRAEEKKIGWKDLFKYRQTIVICITRFISDWVWWFIYFGCRIFWQNTGS